MRKRKVWLGIVLLAIISLGTRAEVIRSTEDAEYPGADTYVTNDLSSQGPGSNHGGATSMRIRQNDESRSKTAYIRFNISEVAGDLSGAFLTFVTTHSKTAGKAVTVYGLTDESLDFWDEMAITYNNAPAMLPADPGFYDLDEAKVVSLGMFMTPTASPPVTISTDPTAVDLTSFLASDTNGAVTFILVGGNDETEFATKEHATYAAPTLTMPHASLGAALDPAPADGASVNRNLLTKLDWKLIPGIARCDVYFGPDPNLLSPLVQKVTLDPAAESLNIDAIPGYSVPLPDGKYYWRIDGYDGAAEPNVFEGIWWSFTATSAPVPTGITPALQAKFAGEDAEAITVSFASSAALTYTWYRSADNANDTDADDVAVGGNSDTLVLTDLTQADDGWYYCKAVSAGGEARSAVSRLLMKRLLAHWAMNGDVADSAGDADGTLMGEPVFVAGVNETTGQALQFDGVDDYVDLPDGFAEFPAGLTISVWANPSAAGSWARFIDLGNGASSDNIYLSRSSNTAALAFNVYTGSTGAAVTAANALVLNEWQMLVATLDEAGNVVLYRNGRPVQTGTLPLPRTVVRTSNFIGDSNWADDAFYAGLIDDLQIYNYAISEDEVADLYAAVAGNYCRYVPEMDLNGDCRVNLGDLAVLAADWLECGFYPECP